MADLRVSLIAKTTFHHVEASDAVDWQWDDSHDDAAALTEFAGRACYQSWGKPNPATATNAGYLAHIQSVGHWSVMEHGTVTFYIQNVSRSLTHELIRHRHLSPSQLSQRFVVLRPDVAERSTDDFVVPPLFDGDPDAEDILLTAWENAMVAYAGLLSKAEEALKRRGVTGTALKKQSREAARAVLPNMTPTAVVVTGNHRAWREMLLKRIQPEADAEIRYMALQIFKLLSSHEPALYQDLGIVWTVDNSPSLQVTA